MVIDELNKFFEYREGYIYYTQKGQELKESLYTRGIYYNGAHIQRGEVKDRNADVFQKVGECEKHAMAYKKAYHTKKKHFQALLEGLTNETQKQVIAMYYFEYMTLKEIAEKLNKTVGCVTVAKKRGLKKLSDTLDFSKNRGKL